VARGSLTVVGTGIRLGIHLTPEARVAIETADEVLHLTSEPLAARWLDGLHARTSNLQTEYRVGDRREEIYERIVERMLAPVRAGRRVAVAFYGHPGVYVRPSHEAVRRARAEGYEARMLPAVSAEDCLFVDLGVDPGLTGCASYDATDFLLRNPTIDTSSALLLWQITVIGDATAVDASALRMDNVPVLVERLVRDYPHDHGVVVYEASPYPVADPLIEHVALERLPEATLSPLSTLYVPPATVRPFDPEMVVRLGFATH
jgi:uncharacterized protein YabN with tetrapyrrole methylase and pyrophosphatase domain